MPKTRRVGRRKIEAVLDLLDRILNEMPTGSFEIVSDDEEDDINIDEIRGAEAASVEAVIDVALSEFMNEGLLPKKEEGFYTLMTAFEAIFGEDVRVSEMAMELENLLVGYQEMISPEDIESASSLIDEMKDEINGHKSVVG
jgi:hypothetical protein